MNRDIRLNSQTTVIYNDIKFHMITETGLTSAQRRRTQYSPWEDQQCYKQNTHTHTLSVTTFSHKQIIKN